MFRSILAVYALSLTIACAPSVHQAALEPDIPATAAQVDVTNDYWSDVNVFLVRGEHRHRLGIVHGGAKAHFVVTARAFPTGSEASVRVEPNDKSVVWISEPFATAQGRTIAFRVAPDVASSMRVW